jgi:hypothetical protein
MVVVGFLLGYTARSINDIWGWIIMGLGGGMLVPYVLRFYWWRFNGGGFAIGLVVGLIGALIQRAVAPDLNELWQFSIMMAIGFTGAIIGTCLTRPTDQRVLEHFYRTTRPLGFWKPFKDKLPQDVREKVTTEHRRDLIALPFALGWHITLFLIPMEIILRTWEKLWWTVTIFLVCLAGLYIFWYRHLKHLDADQDQINARLLEQKQQQESETPRA